MKLRVPLTTLQGAIIHTSPGEGLEKRCPAQVWVCMEMCTTTMAHRIQAVQTRSRAQTHEPAMPLLGMYPEPVLCKNLSAPLCSCSTLHKSKTGKHTLCPQTDDGIRKRVSMYTRQYDSTIKRRPTPPTSTKTHALGSHRHGKKYFCMKRHMSESERHKPWETPSLWNLPKDTKEPL